MIRMSSLAVPAAAITLLTSLSCGAANQPEAVASSIEPLRAPRSVTPACGNISIWPQSTFPLAWQPVSGAAAYTIELDCMNCRGYLDPWASQAGKPWQVKTTTQTSIEAIDTVASIRGEGGKALRWRAWAVDGAGREGAKSDWCVTSFNDTGLPTPGSAVP